MEGSIQLRDHPSQPTPHLLLLPAASALLMTTRTLTSQRESDASYQSLPSQLRKGGLTVRPEKDQGIQGQKVMARNVVTQGWLGQASGLRSPAQPSPRLHRFLAITLAGQQVLMLLPSSPEPSSVHLLEHSNVAAQLQGQCACSVPSQTLGGMKLMNSSCYRYDLLWIKSVQSA